jgi:membrane protein
MFRTTTRLLTATGRHWSQYKVLQLSAALAYYSIFSIAPLLIITVAIAGWIFGADAVRGQLDDQLRGFVGQSSAETLQSMIQSAYKPGQGGWAAVVGIAALILGASGVFAQLKDALNAIWDAPPSKVSGIVSFLRDRVVSFGMVLVIGFLMLISLALTAVVAASWDLLSVYLPLSKVLLSIVGFLISAGITATLFALIFKWLPDVPIRWPHAWTGGVFTAVLFEVGKVLLGIYLGREGTASSYGAAGAVILILLWIYYTSVIVFTGACFTRARRDQAAAARVREIHTPNFASRRESAIEKPNLLHLN